MKIPMNIFGRRRMLAAAYLAAILSTTAACSGVVERKWSEEVELDDGTVIVIERQVKFRESNSLAGDAYSTTQLEGTLGFTGENSSLPAWDVPLTPILLFRDQSLNEWVIVATTSNCDTWYEQGKPVPPYWEYRLRADNWLPSKLSDSSMGRKTNLFFDFEPALPAKKLSLEAKRRVLASKDFAKKYLSVIADLKSRCGY